MLKSCQNTSDFVMLKSCQFLSILAFILKVSKTHKNKNNNNNNNNNFHLLRTALTMLLAVKNERAPARAHLFTLRCADKSSLFSKCLVNNQVSEKKTSFKNQLTDWDDLCLKILTFTIQMVPILCINTVKWLLHGINKPCIRRYHKNDINQEPFDRF